MSSLYPHAVPGVYARWQALRILLRERFLLEALRPLREDAGDVFFLPLPGMQVAVVAGAEAARMALVTLRPLLSSRLQSDPVVQLLRSGMLVIDGEAHDRMRRIAEPFFRPEYLEAHAGRMLQQIDRRIDAWPDGGVVEMDVEMRRLALEILLDVLFKLSEEAAEELWEPLQAARAYIAPGAWLLCPRIPRPSYRKPLQRLDTLIREFIRQRRSEPDQGDLFSAWVQRTDMNDEEIRDQMTTMLIAGHDTVATWLAWTIALLAWHPEIQTRVREEIREQLGENMPDPRSIHRLPLLRAVGMESLRLFPPIPVLNRRALVPLRMCGVSIPSGTRLLISIYTIHRHPKLWKAPESFQPERFLNPEGEGMGFRYLPFGGGPRFCIGAPLARLEGFLALARMLQRVIFTPLASPPRPHLRATLDPWPGVWVRVQRIAVRGSTA